MTVVEATILSKDWISKTDANAAWWAGEMVGKPVLLGIGGKECGTVNEAWIDEQGNVIAEVTVDPSVYVQAFDRWVESGTA